MTLPFYDDPASPAIPGPPPEHFARRSDPDTSKAAARQLGDSFGALTQRVMATLLEVERTCADRPGATAYELRTRMAYDGDRCPETSSICRRFTTLARAGFVYDTGERRLSGAGRFQIAWASTAEGRVWLADIDDRENEEF